MKKKISLVLSAVMLLACIIPSFSLAANDDKGFRDAVKAVKEKIDIPAQYKNVDSNITLYNDIQRWDITWSKDKNRNEGIRVSVDSKGMISSYEKFNYSQSSSEVTVPSVSQEAAKQKAEEFINKMDSTLMGNVKFDDRRNSYNASKYSFTYYRVINNVPFYSNSIYVQVDSQTGEVDSYRCSWSRDLEFPSPDKVINQEKAQEAYKDKLGMRLVYKSKIDYSDNERKINVFIAYEPVYNSNYCIDALTGDVINSSNEISYLCDTFAKTTDQSIAINGLKEGSQSVVLTPEEIAESDKYKGLLSKEDAEKAARGIALLGVDSGYKLVNADLMRSWSEQYIWNLSFNKTDDKNVIISNISTSVDASSGELIRYNIWSNDNQDPKAEAKFDKDASKAEAEKFLKQVIPSKFSQIEYYAPYEKYNNVSETKPTYYNFNYTRKANGILFPDNYVSVGFNAVTGKITSINTNWYSMELPKLGKEVLSIDKVYDKLYSDVGLELQYQSYYSADKVESDKSLVYPLQYNQNNKVRLIYLLKTNKSTIFDAYTGDMLNYDGSAYKEEKPITYSDISGSYGEQEIKALANIGIGFEDGKFNPKDSIKQKDFMYLLAAINGYNLKVSDDNKDKVDEIYSYLRNMNVIKEGEIAKDSIVTREEAAKYIIRSIGLEKAAQIKGIYNVNYKDADKLNSELTGYVVLADGLKLVSAKDGNILPKDSITRADAAVIMYNLLKQKG